MSWLHSLPHQIPFRAASTARKLDDATIEGTFAWTANETLPPEVMLVEAMAQLAGGLAFHETHGPGFLTGIDGCRIDRPIEPGDFVSIVVRLEASFGGTHRFTAAASIGGVEVARGRLYLAAAES